MPILDRMESCCRHIYQAYPPEDTRQHVESMVLPANQEVVLEAIQGNAMEIQMELDPKDAQMVEINVLRSPNKEEFTRIAYFQNRGFRRRFRVPNATGPSATALNANSDQLRNRPIRQESLVTLDNTYSSTLPDVRSRVPETAPVHIEEGETL